MTGTTIKDSVVLVTGANRGLGRAMVEEALNRGAGRVYAAARRPISHPDERVTPLLLDITDEAQLTAAAAGVESLDVLVNNAGVAVLDDLGDRDVLEQHLAVNLYGTYGMAQAFLPQLSRSEGAIVNVVSTAAFTGLPIVPSYSVSKAAGFALTQALRALWASRGIAVHAVIAGPIDTEMSRELDAPKTPAESVARVIFDGVENGDEEIFPDPMSETLADSWNGSAAKAIERELAAMVAPAQPAQLSSSD
jgi:NAD(P)-dependent dehydrogenase (short-subunit alcohol dehydrogenase family)